MQKTLPFFLLALFLGCGFGGYKKGVRLDSVYRDVPYRVEYEHRPDYHHYHTYDHGFVYDGRLEGQEWVIPAQEYHLERGGGGIYHQGGCYSLRGWEFNNRGYPQQIPSNAKIGNCR